VSAVHGVEVVALKCDLVAEDPELLEHCRKGISGPAVQSRWLGCGRGGLDHSWLSPDQESAEGKECPPSGLIRQTGVVEEKRVSGSS
jgi:hypothetical protein